LPERLREVATKTVSQLREGSSTSDAELDVFPPLNDVFTDLTAVSGDLFVMSMDVIDVF
jgi:hypothetical protein